MEAKFSARVKDVITYSREEAIRLKQDFIGTEHLILGMIKEGDGKGIKILQHLNINLHSLKDAIENSLKAFKEDLSINNLSNISLTKRAEKALKITYLEAKRFHTNIIGTEHLLFSILKDESNELVKILNSLGVNYDIAITVYEEEILNSNSKSISGTTIVELSNVTETISSPTRYFSLLFDTSEFSREEIAKIISFLSELYESVGGDELEIVGTNRFHLFPCLETA